MALVVLTVGVAFIDSKAFRPPKSVITTNESGLRVYSWVSEWQGVLMDCLGSLSSGVRGQLGGDPADPGRIWLTAADGGRLEVVWPAGFSVTFEPRAVLRNELAEVVAHAGNEVHLMDVTPEDAAGTPEDPYIASGRVLDGCYSYFSG